MEQGITTVPTGYGTLNTEATEYIEEEIEEAISILNEQGLTIVSVIPISFSFSDNEKKLIVTKVQIVYNKK